jgi:membrane protease YdiL (CAAX protease family)
LIIAAILLAFACWGVTFGVAFGNFWVKIGISVVLVCAYSFVWQRPDIVPSRRSFLLGVLSAVVLYVIFFIGNFLAGCIFHDAGQQVGAIYTLGDGTGRFLVFFLLLLVTGPGEEIFWRGFLQSRMMARWGGLGGYVITTCIYAAVHVFSGNLILTGAALVAGAFWGAMYLWRRDVFMLIISHSLWSSVIFAIAPIR